MTTNKHSYSVSSIRAFATVLILMCHFFQYYGLEIAWWLNVGVQIFLFMSGWLLGKKEIDDSASFLKKRLMRVLPEFFIYLCITIPICLLFIPGYSGIKGALFAL